MVSSRHPTVATFDPSVAIDDKGTISSSGSPEISIQDPMPPNAEEGLRNTCKKVHSYQG